MIMPMYYHRDGTPVDDDDGLTGRGTSKASATNELPSLGSPIPPTRHSRSTCRPCSWA